MMIYLKHIATASVMASRTSLSGTTGPKVWKYKVVGELVTLYCMKSEEGKTLRFDGVDGVSLKVPLVKF